MLKSSARRASKRNIVNVGAPKLLAYHRHDFLDPKVCIPIAAKALKSASKRQSADAVLAPDLAKDQVWQIGEQKSQLEFNRALTSSKLSRAFGERLANLRARKKTHQ